jgi:hypothetical protein
MPDSDTTPRWLLPGPIRRFREHLRAIRQLGDETQAHVLENRRYVIEAHAELADAAARIEARLRELDNQTRALSEAQTAQHEQIVEILRLINSRGHEQRRRLRELRGDPAHALPYKEPEPLISVVMRTYQDHELMRDRAIPSVLAQTYQNFEIVVVGDAAPEDARIAIESFDDPRIRFWNRPYRGPYPDDPDGRWRVIGVPPYNDGVHLARGLWIALLDADDAFRPEHLERLLAHARDERLELAYSRVRVRVGEDRPSRPTVGIPETDTVGRFPPEHGQFMLQSALYHHGLAQIFEADLADGAVGLPQDWALCLRMMEAGVRIGFLNEETVEYYPATARGGIQEERPVKLFTSVLDDTKLLPHFLRHYASAGVSDFYIVAPSELASEIAPLSSDYRITLCRTGFSELRESFRRGNIATDHMSAIRRRHQGEDEWVIIVDLDEFIEFDESLSSIIATADAEGANVVRGIMYDRLAADGQPADVKPDLDLAKQYPVRWRFMRDVRRGWEHKAAIVKGHLDPLPLAEHHHMIGERVASKELRIDHYAWRAGAIERLRERALRLKEVGTSWGEEYDRVLEHYETHGRFAWDEFGGELCETEDELVRGQ